MSKIVALDIKAVKRITAAHIEPDGSMVVIGGDNAAGKSSVLDAIAYAIGGKSLMPAEPLRRGEEKGHAEVTLDDGVVIRRTFTEKGGTLKITTADGMHPSGAQTWLDARIGALSFDPSAFLRSRPQDQAATLRKLCGVDTTDLDAERARLYEERTEIGRNGKTAAGAAEAAPSYEDAPADEVVLADIIQERQEADLMVTELRQTKANAEEHNRVADQQEMDAERDTETATRRAADMEREAADLEVRASVIRRNALGVTAAAKVAAADYAKSVAQHRQDAVRLDTLATGQFQALPDLPAIDERISTAEETNRQVRANVARAKLTAERDGLRADYSALTGQIEAIDSKRAKLLESAEMPLDGLAISTDGVVTYGDIPLDQASQAEQLRVSLGVGLALSPELRIVLIRDGSLLDAAGRQLGAEVAEQAGAQVWVERVGDADDGAIVIEDGAVR